MIEALIFVFSIAFLVACVMSIPYIFSWGLRHFKERDML